MKTLDGLLEKSRLVRPKNIKPKNNALGEWIKIFENEFKLRKKL